MSHLPFFQTRPVTRLSFGKGFGTWNLCLASPPSILDETLVGDAWRAWLHRHWGAAMPVSVEGEVDLVLRTGSLEDAWTLPVPEAACGGGGSALEFAGVARTLGRIVWGAEALTPDPMTAAELPGSALANMTPFHCAASVVAASVVHVAGSGPSSVPRQLAQCVLVQVDSVAAALSSATAAAAGQLYPGGVLVLVCSGEVLPKLSAAASHGDAGSVKHRTTWMSWLRGSSGAVATGEREPIPGGRRDVVIVAARATPSVTRLLEDARAGRFGSRALSSTVTRLHTRIIHGRVYARPSESSVARADSYAPRDLDTMLSNIAASTQLFRASGMPAIDAMCLRALALQAWRKTAAAAAPVEGNSNSTDTSSVTLFPSPMSGSLVLASLTEYRDACTHSCTSGGKLFAHPCTGA